MFGNVIAVSKTNTKWEEIEKEKQNKILFRFGVVCAFVSNQYMQDGTEELTSNLNASITDAKTYLNTTGKHIDTILNVNYDQFEASTFRILNRKSP